MDFFFQRNFSKTQSDGSVTYIDTKKSIIQAIFDSDAKVKGIRGRMNGRDITLDCHVIICANPRGVEDTLVRYLHEAAIVFNGRIIVDRNFQTNDECILAGLHKTRQP